jgi:hypothetical protein
MCNARKDIMRCTSPFECSSCDLDCDRAENSGKVRLQTWQLKQLIPIAEDLLTWCIEEDKKFLYADKIRMIKAATL